jgi:hypothetical protein
MFYALPLKVAALTIKAQDCPYQRHALYRCRSISQLKCMTPVSINWLRATLRQKANKK